MIEVSFCAEQQLVETVTLFREHPVQGFKIRKPDVWTPGYNFQLRNLCFAD